MSATSTGSWTTTPATGERDLRALHQPVIVREFGSACLLELAAGVRTLGAGDLTPEGVEGIVGRRDLAEAEPPQQLRCVSRLVAAYVEPGQPAPGLVHRHQQVEQRDQRGTDAAGAVVQERGEAVGERAAFTQPPAQELALEFAA
ncbi:hypothetical protein [Streptomyces sp. GbtcB7]|uniref:hypothetical protein n=1 Tax=Streptomyces sp. GbtcB7 TaxID=2824752 RepID=UPI001C305D8A|nr:hypothetical protein [Streptomyces sp. GbtcB7]